MSLTQDIDAQRAGSSHKSPLLVYLSHRYSVASTACTPATSDAAFPSR
jgi:hypothetical protein